MHAGQRTLTGLPATLTVQHMKLQLTSNTKINPAINSSSSKFRLQFCLKNLPPL